MKITCPMTVLVLIAGCSARGGYEGIQTSARNACARMPASQYEACLARANVPFEDYVREREALREAEAGRP